MLRGSGLFGDIENIFGHASTVEGIALGPTFEVRFNGSGNVSMSYIDEVNYTALLPDSSQYQQDINLTQLAVKRGTDVVFGSGAAVSQQLYNIMIQKADQPNFAAFTTNIGGHNLSISWQAGVVVSMSRSLITAIIELNKIDNSIKFGAMINTATIITAILDERGILTKCRRSSQS